MPVKLPIAALFCIALPAAALAGPPYVTDDPEPTDYTHYETYLFSGATGTADGSSGAGGIDFNFGAAPDLQLTAVLPYAYDAPRGVAASRGFGNIELAAKYRLLHQDESGIDLAIFPRLFLPSLNARVGGTHASFLLPIWLEKDIGPWSVFGGGGCVLNRSGAGRNYCLSGAVLTRKVLPGLTVGAEVYHQSADTKPGRAMTGLSAGFTYDLTEHYHLMGAYGPGIQNAGLQNRYTWYAALQITY